MEEEEASRDELEKALKDFLDKERIKDVTINSKSRHRRKKRYVEKEFYITSPAGSESS